MSTAIPMFQISAPAHSAAGKAKPNPEREAEGSEFARIFSDEASPRADKAEPRKGASAEESEIAEEVNLEADSDAEAQFDGELPDETADEKDSSLEFVVAEGYSKAQQADSAESAPASQVQKPELNRQVARQKVSANMPENAGMSAQATNDKVPLNAPSAAEKMAGSGEMRPVMGATGKPQLPEVAQPVRAETTPAVATKTLAIQSIFASRLGTDALSAAELPTAKEGAELDGEALKGLGDAVAKDGRLIRPNLATKEAAASAAIPQIQAQSAGRSGGARQDLPIEPSRAPIAPSQTRGAEGVLAAATAKTPSETVADAALASRETSVGSVSPISAEQAFELPTATRLQYATTRYDMGMTRPEMVRNVAMQLMEVVPQANGAGIDLTLSPEELGRVRISLSTHETGVTMVINAERQETIDLMRRNLEQLSREFREMGYSDIDFDFRQQSDSDSQSRQDEPAEGAVQLAIASNDTDSHPIARRSASVDGLDLRL